MKTKILGLAAVICLGLSVHAHAVMVKVLGDGYLYNSLGLGGGMMSPLHNPSGLGTGGSIQGPSGQKIGEFRVWHTILDVPQPSGTFNTVQAEVDVFLNAPYGGPTGTRLIFNRLVGGSYIGGTLSFNVIGASINKAMGMVTITIHDDPLFGNYPMYLSSTMGFSGVGSCGVWPE